MSEKRRFIDHDGCERIGNDFGFNSFVTQEGARKSAQSFARKGTPMHIWRLADGTYDWTSSPDPNIPGHPAELVETTTGQRTGR